MPAWWNTPAEANSNSSQTTVRCSRATASKINDFVVKPEKSGNAEIDAAPTYVPFAVPHVINQLQQPEDAAHVAPFAYIIVGIARVLAEVVAAYRDGSGVSYAHYGADFRRGQGGVNRPAFHNDLTGSWLPAAPDVHSRLARPGARIADIGCGHGWSTIALACAYPDAQVIGYDSDEASTAEAREHATGIDVSFVEADGAALAGEGPFDAIVVLETLHDMARPVDALAAARKALADDGTVIVVDENVASAFTAPGDLTERIMYGWSSHCLPAALAEQPSAGLGTALLQV
jgi:2-polyprenyl-3-methyl-5-hydroxy-6-metoxy-1,4-benzoquinol methylase